MNFKPRPMPGQEMTDEEIEAQCRAVSRASEAYDHFTEDELEEYADSIDSKSKPNLDAVHAAYEAQDLDALRMLLRAATHLAVCVAAVQARCAIKARLDGRIDVALKYESALGAAFAEAGI